ncbi:MAG TPA: mechanosensitive ion channel domain-containing protein [Stellaceae bacterium]|jgi:small-conductance mechanosensitive channel
MRWCFAWIVAAALLLPLGGVRAADAPAAMPQMSGWFEQAVAQVEGEFVSDVSMAPDVWSAVSRDWRSFDRAGSAPGVLVDVGWVAVAAMIALFVQRGVARGLSSRKRQRMRSRAGGPHLGDLFGLLFYEVLGLVGFYAAFTVAQRHLFPAADVTLALSVFSANVLIRWRVVAVINEAILRPDEPVARLVEISDQEAGRLRRFLSLSILAVIALVGFGRYALLDEDSGAPHVIGLINAVLVCGIYIAIVLRSRVVVEALIRGRRTGGPIAAVRDALAGAWMATALALVAGLFVFFIAGLSLGLLSYYHAVTTTLGIWFVVLVLDRLTEKAWHDPEGVIVGSDRLRARTIHHILRATALAVAAMLLAWTWSNAVEISDAAADAAMSSVGAAVATLFVAYIAWELVRLAIDRHLEGAGGGPALPGAESEDELAAPASRLQTILPLLRAAFGIVIGVLAALVVLSRLGVDTAPLIAGAGVFGLAVSFGSQSLVRDIISGLFYMWDDAFRVGEYIDAGRLKGTVETLGIRSVKLRHQNGPLHTIPYGQLGAVTNLSRDFATIKFNLRFQPDTDIETVRKVTKQIGLSMQEDHAELAGEVMLPLKLQGIAEVVDNALVLRFKFTARPVKPSWVQREYLKRMYQAFAEKGIQFATGTTMVLTHMPAPIGAAAPDAGQAAATGVATIAAVDLAEAAIIRSAAG